MIHKILYTQPSNTSLKKALFLDRDGVINVRPARHDYVRKWSEFIFNDGIVDIIKQANLKKFLIIVITNQRGIARQLVSQKDFDEISNNMYRELKSKKATVYAVYYCPHNFDDHCTCRKPEPGLISQAITDYNLSLKDSIMVGDADSDIQAALAAGLTKVSKITVNKPQDFDLSKYV